MATTTSTTFTTTNTIEAIAEELFNNVLPNASVLIKCQTAQTIGNTIGTGSFNCPTTGLTSSQGVLSGSVSSACWSDIVTSSNQALWQVALASAVNVAANSTASGPTLFQYDTYGTKMAALARSNSTWQQISTAAAQALLAMPSSEQVALNISGFTVGNNVATDSCCSVGQMTPVSLYCWAIATNLVKLYLTQNSTTTPAASTTTPTAATTTVASSASSTTATLTPNLDPWYLVVIGALALVTLGFGLLLYFKSKPTQQAASTGYNQAAVNVLPYNSAASMTTPISD